MITNQMIVTVLKTTFQHKEPKCLIYRGYRDFIFENFKSDLHTVYDAFYSSFISSLNKQGPKKEKVLRGNEKPHMNKNLSQS